MEVIMENKTRAYPSIRFLNSKKNRKRRIKGISPRQLGTNPRALGTNPRAKRLSGKDA
jgi:hypothetical protein